LEDGGSRVTITVTFSPQIREARVESYPYAGNRESSRAKSRSVTSRPSPRRSWSRAGGCGSSRKPIRERRKKSSLARARTCVTTFAKFTAPERAGARYNFNLHHLPGSSASSPQALPLLTPLPLPPRRITLVVVVVASRVIIRAWNNRRAIKSRSRPL
jgi:hypothetical protein